MTRTDHLPVPVIASSVVTVDGTTYALTPDKQLFVSRQSEGFVGSVVVARSGRASLARARRSGRAEAGPS